MIDKSPLNARYGVLCQTLGDAITQRDAAEKRIKETREEINALNIAAPLINILSEPIPAPEAPPPPPPLPDPENEGGKATGKAGKP